MLIVGVLEGQWHLQLYLKFDFNKILWLLSWNITSHRSKQPVTGNVRDDGSYSILSRGVVKVPERVLVEREAVEMIWKTILLFCKMK